MRMYRHRLLRAFALAGAVSAALAACSPAGSGDAKSSTGPLVVARTVDLDQLDPAVATAFGTTQTLQLVFDTLLRTDADGRLVPGLAKSWETGKDGRTLTFHLQPGVKFHNGDALTADAVVATLDRVRDEATASVVRSNLLNVSAVTAPDPATAVIKLTKPDGSILNTLTLVGTAILDPPPWSARGSSPPPTSRRAGSPRARTAPARSSSRAVRRARRSTSPPTPPT